MVDEIKYGRLEENSQIGSKEGDEAKLTIVDSLMSSTERFI